MKDKHLIFNSFHLKLIAILTMTIDHIGYYLQYYGSNNSVMGNIGDIFRIIGRISFPIFIFLLAVGLNKTHDRLNYILRLAILWAVIFIIQFIVNTTNVFGLEMLNAQAFTDLLCYALFIYLIEKKGWWKALAILPAGFVILSYIMQASEIYAAANNMTSVWTTYIPEWARCAYSLFGFLMFLGMYYGPKIANRILASMEKKENVDMSAYKEGRKFQGLVNTIAITSIVFVTVIFWALAYFVPSIDPYFSILPQSYCILACLFIAFYNGEKGYGAKWFKYGSYLYYPLHLALIGIIFGLIF